MGEMERDPVLMPVPAREHLMLGETSEESSKNDSEVWRKISEQETFQTCHVQVIRTKSEKLPPYGDGRDSEERMKKSITQVRLELKKTAVKTGRRSNVLKQAPKETGGFSVSSEQIGLSLTQGTGAWMTAGGGKKWVMILR